MGAAKIYGVSWLRPFAAMEVVTTAIDFSQAHINS
jgi:hypothetical protein